jgi:NAD-dependent deacetylase
MEVQKLKSLISQSSNIIFFGGAGVSTESNIPDFRSENGIYRAKTKYGYSPEVMLSHSFFIKHTEKFYDFYRNQMIYKDAKPNQAHLALAELEQAGKLKAVITQNIDGLHQLAGSREVLELHGSIHRNTCMKCGQSYNLDYIINSTGVPKCSKCGGTIKPDVVLYEEMLNEDTLDKAVRYIHNADVLIVGGTSLAVYPAAGLIEYYRGDKLVLINKSATSYDENANIIIHDSIGKVLREAVG